MKFVKCLLLVFAYTGIFFLTGCAGGRYHEGVDGAATPQGTAYRAPVSSAADFRWPIQGQVRVPFGQKDEGVTLKGVLLSGREGADVSAIADGFVAYADPSLRGFGQTIVVDHRNGYSSVYARSAGILVVTGQEVRRGQPIARLGSSGKGSKPELYLEIRRNSKPEDPLRLLRS